MRLKWNQWAGLAGLGLVIIAALLYTVRGSADLVFWLPLGLGLAALAMYAVENREEAASLFKSRKARHGMNNIFLGVLALAAAVFLQAIISNHDLSWDLSKGQAHTLSDESVKAMKNLDQDVLVYAFYGPSVPQAAEFEDLLKRLKEVNPARFKYEMADMNSKPLLAQQYAVRKGGTSVVVTDKRSELVTTAKEEDLVNALVKLGSGASQVVYITSGHGEKFVEDAEPSGLSEFKKGLENSSFTVRAINLDQQPKVPEDCATLILAGPRSDYSAPELSILDDYLGRGGRLVVAMDPRVPLANLSAWLRRSGIVIGNDVVVDFNPINQLFGGSPIAPIIANFDHEHPITKDIAAARAQIIAPVCRSISLSVSLPAGVHGTTLATTFDSAWSYRGTANQVPNKRGPGDGKGPLSVAAAVEADPKLFAKNPADAGAKPARLVVYGSSGIFGNNGIALFNNQDFSINAVRWLADDEKHIAIAPKSEETAPISLQKSTYALIGWSLGLLCVGTLVLGIAVMLRRKRALG